MTTTPNLLLSHIVASQSQKEVTANAALDGLDQALCQPSIIAMTDANLTLTDAQMLGNMFLSITGTLTAARTITVPAHPKLILIENDTTGGFALNVQLPSGTAIAFNSGDLKLLYCDGSTLRTVAYVAASSGNPYDIGCSVAGTPAANATLLRYPMPRAVTFPAGMANSKAIANTAATASTTFSVKKNGTQFATFVFAASGTSATFAAASSTAFAAGDVLTITAPATPDATLADLGIALAATR
jgi:hypothetical protein